MTSRQNWLQNILVCSLTLLASTPANAQITPDNTLGAENSRFTPNVQVDGAAADRIEGGATRGSNLFHSFSQFNVGDGQRVYFGNPNGIQNILTRVTGGQASNILGTLGVDGGANLFLLNPNGIIFGQNASLDVRSSFVGTTANAFGFGERGNFSATNPQAPPLLTVNPSALLFTQLQANAGIINQSIAPAGVNPEGNQTTGLRVPDGKSLLLVGGNVNVDGGRIRAYGGRVELTGLAAPGSIGLNVAENNLSLNVPNDVPRADVALTNQAAISVFGAGSGDIAINAHNLEISNSALYAGIGENLGNTGTQAGDITLNATEAITIAQTSSIENSVYTNAKGNAGNINISGRSLSLKDEAKLTTTTFGEGNAGSIFIQAQDFVSLVYSDIFSNVDAGGVGLGGDINITAGSLSVNEGSQIQTLLRNTQNNLPAARGDAGNVNIDIRGAVSIAGVKNGFSSLIASNVSTGAEGNGGDINIKSGTFSVTDGAQVDASTVGQGDAGSISLQVSDEVFLSGRGTAILSNVDNDAVGQGGDIRIATGILSLTNGAQLGTSTFGQGDAGSVSVKARDITFQGLVPLDDGNILPSGILTQVQAEAIGNAGDVQITTGSLSLFDGATIATNTRGLGNAGNISIDASDRVSLKNTVSGISSIVERNGVGQGGTIQISTESLSVSDFSFITSSTDGQGDAGSIFIEANSLSMTRSDPTLFASGSISTGTTRQGNAGNITINVRDTISTDKGLIASSVLDSGSSDLGFAGKGQGGDIRITTGSLQLTNNAALSASSSGQGDAGNIFVNARDTISIDSGSNISTNITSSNGSTAKGQAGDIQINARSLFIINGGLVFSTTAGQGNAGNIDIRAIDKVVLDSGSNNSLTAISSSVLADGVGRGGDIQITTGSLSLANNAQILASTGGEGNSGNIALKIDDAVSLTNSSSIRAAVEFGGVGTAGDIDIQARSLSVIGGSNIASSLFRPLGNLPAAQGRGGNIQVNTSDSVTISGVGTTGFSSGLITNTGREATGNAGDITVSTSNFKVSDGAIVLAGTAGFGDGGKITINTNSFEALNGGTVITNTQGSGKAGTVTLNAAESITIAGSEPNFSDRRAQVEQRLRQPGETDRLTDVVVNTDGASGIFASTAPGSTGDGGSIFIDPPQVTIRDGAKISVNSEGTGNAGNITLQAGTLNLDNGTISAQTASSQGGNIDLQLGDILLLRRISQISTTAGTAAAGGDGGNITLNTPLIVAVPNENSDITANAFSGSGGNISISAESIFGIQARSQPTPLSDITASSQLGAQGQISFTEPNVQPEQGLVELPGQILDASNQIAQTCPNGATANRSLGEFVVTGRGSLPPNPLEPIAGTTSLSPLATLDGEGSSNLASTSLTPTIPPTPTKIIEAQGWVKTTNGKVMLVASAPEATPDAATTSAACPVSK